MYTVNNNQTHILLTIKENYKQFEDGSARSSNVALELNDAVYNMLNEVSQPVPAVLDIRNLRLSFSDIVQALGDTRRSESMFHHPKLSEIIVITENGLIQFAAMALKQAQYGNLSVNAVKSLEEAETYLQQAIPA